MIPTLIGIGFTVAFCSGLLGVGGAILLIPALLYLPPLFGVGSLEMRTIAAISMMQVLAASLVGVFGHKRQGFVSIPLVAWMGSAILIASLTGALVSKGAGNRLLEAIFASMAIIAATVMFIPRPAADDEAREVPFNRPLAVLIASGVGFFGGMVGAPGAFLLIPLMIYALNLPTRIVLGSTLGIVLLSALAGAAGKLATGQVPYGLAAALIALTGLRMWYSILTR